MKREPKGSMTVAEAGRKGGLLRPSSGGMSVAEAGRKGGITARDRHGHEFYVEIGRKGGAKVREAFAALREREEGKAPPPVRRKGAKAEAEAEKVDGPARDHRGVKF